MIEKEISDILDPLIKAFSARLLQRLNGYMIMAYLQGSAQMVEWGKTKGGMPIYFEGPPIQEAIDYAREHCAELVTRMDEETKTRLAQLISEGIENKRGIPGLARDIKNEFDNMTTYRSQLIARTETCDALEQSFMDTSVKMGINGKEWMVTIDCCPICADCEAQGVVSIDFDYPHDGIDPKRPPAHPACRCALAPAMLPK